MMDKEKLLARFEAAVVADHEAEAEWFSVPVGSDREWRAAAKKRRKAEGELAQLRSELKSLIVKGDN